MATLAHFPSHVLTAVRVMVLTWTCFLSSVFAGSDITLNNIRDWNYANTGDSGARFYTDPVAGLFEQTADGISVRTDIYRGNGNITSKDVFYLAGKTVEYTWSGDGGGAFCSVVLGQTTTAYWPSNGGLTADCVHATFGNTWAGSWVASANHVYRTTVSFTATTFSATTVDAASNVVQDSRNGNFDYTKPVYIVFGNSDTYLRSSAYMLLRGFRLIDGLETHPIADYPIDPFRPPTRIDNAGFESPGRYSFTFVTPNTGGKCLLAWTKNFQDWYPLLQFDANTTGTRVVDNGATQSAKCYRATYLPTGVQAADAFDYPIGDLGLNPDGSVRMTGVLEFPGSTINERNDLYPNKIPGAIRGLDSGKGWHNAQDVGSYNSDNGLYHSGEDWNLGARSDDLGQPVHAIANGIVVDISHLNNHSLESGGWAVVIRHYRPNGDSIDSVYEHIAPPVLADQTTANDGNHFGDESWFPYQEGMPVSRGAVIGVIGAITGISTPAFPHLHFEIRTKPISGLPLALGEAASSHYWPHAVGTSTYYSSFANMQEDGIEDPSDFLDDHRR